ncbi:MAG: hypothetical protein KatS3mg082_3049 [Nitrospiraceae bacterium]|nr:MAG: hypothetical protein KatS3mg082_3049 [Nitrospiraceae bacterium]
MGIRYESLDDNVRRYMIEELERDIESRQLYISPRLTDEGARVWPELLREAFHDHDDDWLASQLRIRGLMRHTEQRRTPQGRLTTAQVPRTAPETLAEGEFNRFYARGLCRHVIETGGAEVEAYRGKEVRNPRPESQAMIGRRLQARDLLNDLRVSHGVEPALGLPPGPNSGLTVRRAGRQCGADRKP